MKQVNLQLTQGDAFFRFSMELEESQVNAKGISIAMAEKLLSFHERYVKYVKGKSKSYNLKFGKPFTMSAYIEDVRGINGTFYHEMSNFFFDVENADGKLDVTCRLTKSDSTKVTIATFIEDWMSDVFQNKRKFASIDEVLDTYTTTEVCEDCKEA